MADVLRALLTAMPSQKQPSDLWQGKQPQFVQQPVKNPCPQSSTFRLFFIIRVEEVAQLPGALDVSTEASKTFISIFLPSSWRFYPMCPAGKEFNESGQALAQGEQVKAAYLKWKSDFIL